MAAAVMFLALKLEEYQKVKMLDLIRVFDRLGQRREGISERRMKIVEAGTKVSIAGPWRDHMRHGRRHWQPPTFLVCLHRNTCWPRSASSSMSATCCESLGSLFTVTTRTSY
jgi:hypothetical protein